jgi:mono/diheme cytochrome c family protein
VGGLRFDNPADRVALLQISPPMAAAWNRVQAGGMMQSMTRERERPSHMFSIRPRLLRAITAFAFLAGALIAAPAPLAAQDASDIAEGARLFRQKGNCQSCHGWAGDGRKMDTQMPDGANLRETRLDRAALVMTIKCGLPGTGMPPYDRFAYSDGRCYGLKQADLRASGQRMADPPATLQNREIEYIADFLFAKVIGKGPMDRAKCVAFWGEETDACEEFPK